MSIARLDSLDQVQIDNVGPVYSETISQTRDEYVESCSFQSDTLARNVKSEHQREQLENAGDIFYLLGKELLAIIKSDSLVE